MSAIGGNPYKDNAKSSFWKKGSKTVPGSIKPVYGAQHPPMQEPLHSSGPTTPTKKEKHGKHGRDTFQDFQDKTSDAWDDAEDDLMVMSNIRLSKRDVQNTALQVLSNHSQQVKSGQLNSSQSLEEDDSAEQQVLNNSGSSAPCTPSHTPGSRHSGPGVGVRLNTHWQIPKVIPAHIGLMPVPDRESSKIGKFKSLLESSTIDLDELRTISWSGIPPQFRPIIWKLLSGYIPPILDRQQITLQRKRQEYFNFLDQYLETRHQEIHQHTFRQIHIDIPRMSPLIAIFQQKVVQEIFERILYIWAIRHPASGYVQGINDLVTPFFVVFLTEYLHPEDVDLNTLDMNCLSTEQLGTLEADSFWCFSKLLDGIQDNYTFAQPGIQTRVQALYDLVSRIDSELHSHLCTQHIEYLQFSFRWMNNLLMREMPLSCVIHIWDTYLSEPEGFSHFHLYVCAAFLTKFSKELQRERDFQGLMIMLQNLPTQNWSKEEIGLLMAEAFKLKYMFADAPNHLSQTK